MRSNGVTELKIWVLQYRCFFSDFHEVPTCDEIMGKWSQEEMKEEMYSIISQAIVF